MYDSRKPHNMREVKEFNYQICVLLAAHPVETHIDQAMLRVKLIRYERKISEIRTIKNVRGYTLKRAYQKCRSGI